jgi:hypothetical protein
MFEARGRQMLALLGKDSTENSGIITVDQLPGAISALQQAVATDKAAPNGGVVVDGIRLSQRAPPILELLERSLKDETPVTWGV